MGPSLERESWIQLARVEALLGKQRSSWSQDVRISGANGCAPWSTCCKRRSMTTAPYIPNSQTLPKHIKQNSTKWIHHAHWHDCANHGCRVLPPASWLLVVPCDIFRHVNLSGPSIAALNSILSEVQSQDHSRLLFRTLVVKSVHVYPKIIKALSETCLSVRSLACMCTQANANTTRAELIISNGFCKCVFKRWTQTPLFTPESWANLRTLSLGPLARWRPKAKGPYFACSEACCSTCCQRYIGHICPTLKNTGLGRLSLNASHSRSWHQMRTDSMSPQLKLFHPRGQQRCLFCPVPSKKC